jgi:glycosyltransferase involved in cell wall biosynthesis
MRALICCDYYLPGYLAGGPIRSLSNLVAAESERVEFHIVTRDRDLGASEPYRDVNPGVWTPVGAAQVRYLSASEMNSASILQAVRDVNPDVIFLNSLLSPIFTVAVLWLRRIGKVRTPVVLAPRGELSADALRLKAWKKRPFLLAARELGLYDGLTWVVTSDHERADLLDWLGRRGRSAHIVQIEPSPPAASAVEPAALWPERDPARLRIVFLSRIAPMKNLLGAIRILAGLGEPCSFDIYGPVEHSDYWKSCQSAIEALPPDVEVTVHGPVEPSQVLSTLADRDVLLLPTLGENFGHVILESLTAGCPVVISDRTPWRNLEAEGVGFDVALQDEEAFRDALRKISHLDASGQRALRERCRKHALSWVNSRNQEYASTFEEAAARQQRQAS